MRIDTIECFAVTLPIEAPILTCYGSLATYSRTVIKITADNGLVGWGETSGRYKVPVFERFARALRGSSPWDTTYATNRVKHWNYYPYEKPEPVMAAIEMACLDLAGKAAGEPVWRLLGGRVQQRVPVAGYLFYRHANADGQGEVHDVASLVAHARWQVERYGFGSLKLKGGYYPPETDRDALEALRDTFGRDMRLRIDPQGSWTPATAIRIGQDIDRLGLEYYEDPCWNAAGMAAVRARVRTPLATNMCVNQFEDLFPAVRMGAIDVVLADPWYWGGMRACIAADRACHTMGIDLGVHSGAELGIGWAAMLHLAVAMPSLRLAIDCMNIHLTDDILVGGKIDPVDGMAAPPDGPGLGIEVDEAKLARYGSLANSGQAVDRFLDPNLADSARPGWHPSMPAW